MAIKRPVCHFLIYFFFFFNQVKILTLSVILNLKSSLSQQLSPSLRSTAVYVLQDQVAESLYFLYKCFTSE